MIVILGSGISGLCAATILKQKDPVLIGEIIGGDWIAGGLKYIHHSDSVLRLLDEMGYGTVEIYNVKGGVFLDGKLIKFPIKDKELARMIQVKHYLKTRYGRNFIKLDIPYDCMNNLGGNDKSVKLDSGEFINKILDSVRERGIINNKIVWVNFIKKYLLLDDGRKLKFDEVISTIPLPILSKMSEGIYFPEDMEYKKTIIFKFCVLDSEIKDGNRHWKNWDYIYTPETQNGLVYRISSYNKRKNIFHAEVSSSCIDPHDDFQHTHLCVMEELSDIFRCDIKMFEISIIKGHILKGDRYIEIPDYVHFLGRYSSWNPRETVDKVVEKCYKLEGEI